MSIVTRMILPSLLSLAMVGAAAAQSGTTVPQTMGSQPQAAGTPPPTSTTGDILNQQEPGQTLTSEVIGLTLVDEEGNDLGRISDLIMDEQQQVIGAVVSVGGFLGLGSKSVGLPWQALRVETREGNTVAIVGMSEQELAEAVEFKTLAQIQAEAAALERAAQQQQTPTSPGGGYSPRSQ